MKARSHSLRTRDCEISLEAAELVELRTAQLLTSSALMLALDESISTDEASADLARLSRGDLKTLALVECQIRDIAGAHPGPGADRALVIVGGAVSRVAALNRHPSSDSRPWVLFLNA